MWFFILFITLLLLTAFTYFIFDKELMAPGLMICLMFDVSVTYSLYNYERWQLTGYGAEMVLLALLGISCFISADIITRKLIYRGETETTFKTQRTEIPYSRIILAVIIGVLAVILYVMYLRRIIWYFGLSQGINDAIQTVRKKRQAGELTGGLGLPVFINLLIKSVQMFSVLFSFAYVYNIVIRRHEKKDNWLLVPVVLHVIVSLLQSKRGDVVQDIIAVMVFSYIVWSRYERSCSRINRWFLLGSTLTVVTVSPLFFIATRIMGRYDADSIKSIDMFYYIGVYLSGGLRSFDLYLKQGGSAARFFGEETFVTLNNFIFSHFGGGESYVRHLEYRSGNGWGSGNIYSSFRRFYHDFGIWGICILSFIQGLISSLVYERTRREKTDDISFSIVLYSFFAYTIVYIPIDDLFFSSVISVSGLAKTVLLYIIYIFVFMDEGSCKEVRNRILRTAFLKRS